MIHTPLRLLGVIAAAVLGLTAPSLAQDTTGVGVIRGTVRDAAGAGVAGVRVCALDTPQCAATSADGAFRLTGLRAGSYRLEILPPEGHPFKSDAVEVRAGLDSAVDVSLPKVGQLQETVTVTEPAFVAPAEVKTSGFLVDPRDVLKSAGALQDVSRYIQSLPGVVVGTDDSRNDIIVRGGSPLETLFIVDNIEIPNINSFATVASAGGFTSLLNLQTVQDVTFLSGGYPAPYINRTSGVLQVTQREGNRERLGGLATLGFGGAGGIVEGPLGRSKKGSWIVSARRSFLDIFTKDIGEGGVPVYYTLNAKAVYDLSARDRIWAVNVSGWDTIRLGLTANTKPEDELSTLDIRYNGWRAATGVNWQHIFGARAVGLLGVSYSEARTSRRVRDLARTTAPPTSNPDEIIASSPTVYSEDSRERETTLKYDLTVSLPRLEKLQVGGAFKAFPIGYQVRSPFGNDTPFSPVPGVDPFTLNNRFTAYQTGAYVQATGNLTSRVNATLGARVDDYQYLSATRVSPRAGVTVKLADSLFWNANYGAYYQQPGFLFLATFTENRRVRPWRADHYITSLAWTPAPGLRTTLEVYRKNYRDYPVAASLRTVSLANVGDSFNVREILFPLVSAGRGRAVGVEWFLEKRFSGGLYGNANLAYSRSRHAALDGVLRPGAFDRPIVANLSGGYRLSDKWEVSTRLAILSGRPYTPFDEGLSTAQRRGVYDLSRVNALRLPTYFRWDVRVDRTLRIADQPFTLFAGVQNLTNRRNVAEFTWSQRTNALAVSKQQGIFPIFGFDWRF